VTQLVSRQESAAVPPFSCGLKVHRLGRRPQTPAVSFNLDLSNILHAPPVDSGAALPAECRINP
jgi:hypothetical protein